MSVNFYYSSYFNAILNNEDFVNKKDVFNYAKSNPQFKYGQVTYKKFTEANLSSSGWFGRKITALPAAAWSGVVKTIYHLTKALFIGIFRSFTDQGKYFKAQIFYIGRDFQEVFGRLSSIFSDSYGQYHIQGSGFHKSCYDCFTATSITELMQLAESYLKDGEREKALQTIQSLHVDKAAKSTFVVKVMESYFKEGKLEKAFEEMVKNRFEMTLKDANTCFRKITKLYLQQGAVSKALKANRNILCYDFTKDLMIFKMAESYFKKGDASAAISAIKKLYSDTEKKEALIRTFFKKENLAKEIAKELLHEQDFFSNEEFIDFFKEHFSSKHFASIHDSSYISDEFCAYFFTNKSKGGFLDGYYKARLGLEPTASKEEIKEAYKRLSLKYHPDKVLQNFYKKTNETPMTMEEGLEESQKKRADEQFKKISDAYFALIKDPWNGSHIEQKRILGLEPAASADAIKTAYKKKVLQNSYKKPVIKEEEWEETIKISLQFLNESQKKRADRQFKKISKAYSALIKDPWNASHTEQKRILGLEPEASIDAIKKAYKKLALEHHPDKIAYHSRKRSAARAKMTPEEKEEAFNKLLLEDAKAQFQRISNAYTELTK